MNPSDRPTWRGLANKFDKSAGRHNHEIMAFRHDVAEVELDEAIWREVGEACDRWLRKRRMLRGAWKNHDFLFTENSQKKTVDTPHTFTYKSPQL
jgi:hypothetical protein